ncbi:hypothetical protein VB711_10715 [Cronbergia sp. UHCC 0137]|uniref:heterocyst-inhibiting protein PatX n=1 Tax=Cronbergia sp. UHCC 0137 TaxID=3110239 RepID=UPI002B211F03|nr:hypothetical protein [Cronbergia sp. UHCC 0137]MEA5618305.1 hypothetical protein [Cronbergia sp. UHCC 0137]
MRTTFSLLVSSLVLGSLAFNCISELSSLLTSSSSQELVASRTKVGPTQPEQPLPHRGSGRREFMEDDGNIYSAA